MTPAEHSEDFLVVGPEYTEKVHGNLYISKATMSNRTAKIALSQSSLGLDLGLDASALPVFPLLVNINDHNSIGYFWCLVAGSEIVGDVIVLIDSLHGQLFGASEEPSVAEEASRLKVESFSRFETVKVTPESGWIYVQITLSFGRDGRRTEEEDIRTPPGIWKTLHGTC